MKYEKPEVVAIDSAIACVQSEQAKPNSGVTDSRPFNTLAAYEADE